MSTPSRQSSPAMLNAIGGSGVTPVQPDLRQTGDLEVAFPVDPDVGQLLQEHLALAPDRRAEHVTAADAAAGLGEQPVAVRPQLTVERGDVALHGEDLHRPLQLDG